MTHNPPTRQLDEEHRAALSEALHLGNGAPWDAIINRAGELSRRDVESRQPQSRAEDTLPAWLAKRFDPRGADWDGMSDDDRAYWAHQAAAVRRAVARGGFRTARPAVRPAVETGA